MDANDRELITGLFSRMQGMRGIEKDAEAAQLIARETADNPDAAYLLTQSVLVQEQALQAANARIQELEAQIADQSQQGAQQPVTASEVDGAGTNGSTSFARRPRSTGRGALGGMGSVPSTGRQSPSVGSAGGPQQAANTPQQRGGGFMAQAMSTAVGVAGGMLLASGISSLMSGGSTAEAATPGGEDAAAGAGADEPAPEAAAAEPSDPAMEEPEVQDAADEDGGWFGGFDDFGGDFEI